MKTLFLLFSSIFFAMTLNAQDDNSWQVKWNGEKVLSATQENETANKRTVKIPKKHSKSKLEVEYGPKNEDIKRSFIIFGKNDNELIRFNDTWSLEICYADLLKAIGGEKEIQIYTIGIPADPDLAARVRVRRVHLCTLILQ